MSPEVVAAWISEIEASDVAELLLPPSQALSPAQLKRRRQQGSPSSQDCEYPIDHGIHPANSCQHFALPAPAPLRKPSCKRLRTTATKTTQRPALRPLHANTVLTTATKRKMASTGAGTGKNVRAGPRDRSPGKPAVRSSGLTRRTRNTAPIQEEDDAGKEAEGAAESAEDADCGGEVWASPATPAGAPQRTSAAAEDLDADGGPTPRPSAYARALQTREVPSLPPPSPSRAPSTYTASTKRSSSPVKSPLDLLANLGKPVQYNLVEEPVILKKLKKNPIAPVYRRIRSLCHTQYIPAQMRDTLEREEEEDDDGGGLGEDELDEPDDKQDDVLGLGLPDSDYGLPLVGAQQVLINHALAAVLPAEVDHLLFQLRCEFTILQDPVSATREYTRVPHSEAAWNGAIHYPLLRLATAHIDNVTVEDITKATISLRCAPDGKEFGDGDGGRVALSSSTKMVDYALLLSGPSSPSLSRASRGPPGHDWLNFVGRQHAMNPGMPQSFNQTEYSPLRYSPAGLFVESKVDSGSQNEGRTQLGMWVAAWFKRVNAFRLSKQVQPPVVPVLLVYNETWDLYFAMDRGSWIVSTLATTLFLSALTSGTC